MFFGCVLVFAGIFSGVRPALAQSDDVCRRPDGLQAIDPNATTAEQVENGEATLAAFVTDFATYVLQISTSPLADGVQPAGRYSVSFDGAGLASGTYLYVLRTEQNVSVKKMILLK